MTAAGPLHNHNTPSQRWMCALDSYWYESIEIDVRCRRLLPYGIRSFWFVIKCDSSILMAVRLLKQQKWIDSSFCLVFYKALESVFQLVPKYAFIWHFLKQRQSQYILIFIYKIRCYFWWALFAVFEMRNNFWHSSFTQVKDTSSHLAHVKHSFIWNRCVVVAGTRHDVRALFVFFCFDMARYDISHGFWRTLIASYANRFNDIVSAWISELLCKR